MRTLLILLILAPVTIEAGGPYDSPYGYDERDRASTRLYYDELRPTPSEPEPELREPYGFPVFPQDDIAYDGVYGYDLIPEEPLLEIPTHRHQAKGFEDRLRSYSRSQSLEDLTHGHIGLKRLGGPQILEGRAGHPRRGGL